MKFYKRNKQQFSTLFCAVFLMALTPISFAHHSVGYHFDKDAPAEIEGVVKEFLFRNPHSELIVDVTDENGNIISWHVEMTSQRTMYKQGWTEEQFIPGQKVRISGFLARRDEHSIYLRLAEFIDGSTTSFEYGQLATAAPTPSNSTDSKEQNSPLGTWVRTVQPEDPMADGQPPEPNEKSPYLSNLTEVGMTASQAYVAERDDPALNCQLPSIMRAWPQPDFSPTQISLEDDILTIRHEVFDTVRTVYMGKQARQNNIKPSVLGHSTGRFEGETLIVETTGFKAGILVTHPGIFHSDQLNIVETLSVDKETGVLHVEWSATDPVNFTSPQLGSFYFVRSNAEIGEFNCQL